MQFSPRIHLGIHTPSSFSFPYALGDSALVPFFISFLVLRSASSYDSLVDDAPLQYQCMNLYRVIFVCVASPSPLRRPTRCFLEHTEYIHYCILPGPFICIYGFPSTFFILFITQPALPEPALSGSNLAPVIDTHPLLFPVHRLTLNLTLFASFYSSPSSPPPPVSAIKM